MAEVKRCRNAGMVLAKCIVRAKLGGVHLAWFLLRARRADQKVSLPSCDANAKMRQTAQHDAPWFAALRHNSFQWERMLFSHPAMEWMKGARNEWSNGCSVRSNESGHTVPSCEGMIKG